MLYRDYIWIISPHSLLTTSKISAHVSLRIASVYFLDDAIFVLSRADGP